MYDWPQTLAAERSVNAIWPVAAGCHHTASGVRHVINSRWLVRCNDSLSLSDTYVSVWLSRAPD